MTDSQTVVIDFVVRGKSADVMKIVLVEEGDWSDIDSRLRKLQQRMYGCVDAAIYGQLAEKFPETIGKKIIVSVDFYDSPRIDADEFFERFSKNVFSLSPYGDALKKSRFVDEVFFEANFETLQS